MYQPRPTQHLSLALPPSEPETKDGASAALESPNGPAYGLHSLLLAGLLGGALVGVYLGSGQHLTEKVLKALATPLGIVWGTLLLLGYFQLLRRQIATARWPVINSSAAG